jgi:stress-induced morphogen
MPAGQRLLAQHRSVNDALAAEIAVIHALTLKTMTPAQWEAAQAATPPPPGGMER